MNAYTMEVRPQEELTSGRVQGIMADERCLAILIDYATNIFEVCKLRPELRYWQERIFHGTATAPQIAAFYRKMIEAFERVPKFSDDETRLLTTTLEAPVQFQSRPMTHRLSKPALEAARFIFHYYRVTPRRGRADDQIDRLRIAKLIDVSIEWTRAARANELVKQADKLLKAGQATEDDIKFCFRRVGVLLETIPNYSEREEETKIL